MYRFEIEINSTHALILLTVVAVVYAGYTMYFMIRENHRADRREYRKQKTASSSSDSKPKADIMGKSKFVLTQSAPSPQVTVAPDIEPNTRKAATFASETIPKYSRQITQDELDEVFGRAPEGESNEPLKIHHPLYFGQSLPREIADDNEDDENEDLPLRSHRRAQGVRFEELGDAYNRVVHAPYMTTKEEVETGRILLELKHTDMFEYIVSGEHKRQNKALYLIDIYLTAFQRRMMAEDAENPESEDVIVAPQGYSISDDAKPIRRQR
jgi:hypothetical protein